MDIWAHMNLAIALHKRSITHINNVNHFYMAVKAYPQAKFAICGDSIFFKCSITGICGLCYKLRITY
jgi:hypothetical protein